ncbi:MAG: hypothetical protein SFY32_03210 [Bacteroidota bacterium]|nr:hypothetical protein [Bacteroidota bacterium]
MDFKQVFRLIILIFSAFIIFSCQKTTELVPVLGWNNVYPYLNTSTTGVASTTGFNKSLINSIDTKLKSYLDSMPIPATLSTDSLSLINQSLFVVQRNGTDATPFTGLMTGSPFSSISLNLLQMITLKNKPFAEISASDSIFAWFPMSTNYINTDGSMEDISLRLDSALVKSLSQTLIFFPDGYYIFVNNLDQNLNSFGIYQIAVNGDGLPQGIIYKSQKSGKKFTNPPINKPPYSQRWQGFGIWGLAPSRFYPAVLINTRPAIDAVVLTMKPIGF